ncbi:MAG: bifunctional riboflavin kinase/FAD synthetase [Syntrophales bacterium]|nr:bifunctional riboflavin kinase/FAD synthetase [Syntrophales bacterium]
MDIIRGYEAIPQKLHGAYVTIGNFDGVHLGHQYIFRKLVDEAHATGSRAAVITFEPHPKMVLHPERKPFYLIATLQEKIDLIAQQGIDALILIPFSFEFAATTAEEFVRHILWDKLRMKKIMIGHDYTFGRGKEGNEAFLKAFGEKLGFTVEVMNAFRIGDVIISSTLVRNTILAGNVKKAATYLGRPYNLVGTVVEGHHRGAGLGFPTANIEPEKVLIPAGGVYAAMIRLGGKTYRAVMNIGSNPTFGDNQQSIEVFLLDFHEDIYGKPLEILFIDKLRDEMKFPTPQALIEQIRSDVSRAKEILQPYRE